MNKTLILCDLDGTLIDSDRLNTFSYTAALRQLGFRVPPDLAAAKRITEKELRSSMPSLSEADILQIKQLKLEIFLKHVNMLRVNTALLDEITRSGAVFCICTSSKSERAEPECKLLNISCDAIVSSEKSKAELERIVRELSEKVGAFDRVVCYDDNENVLSAASECGFEAVPVRFEDCGF